MFAGRSVFSMVDDSNSSERPKELTMLNYHFGVDAAAERQRTFVAEAQAHHRANQARCRQRAHARAADAKPTRIGTWRAARASRQRLCAEP
jgi:hypothetical protein